MTVIDISVPIQPDMIVYEGDPGVEITPFASIAEGAPANVSRLSLGSHTGTHLDAPAHFLSGGATVDRLSWDALLGRVLVAAAPDVTLIGRRELEPLPLDGHSRLLLKTGNSALWSLSRFSRDYA